MDDEFFKNEPMMMPDLTKRAKTGFGATTKESPNNAKNALTPLLNQPKAEQVT